MPASPQLILSPASPSLPAHIRSQSYRTMHSTDHKQWPTIFGRLFADFQAGKLQSDWSKYQTDNSGLAASAHKGGTESAGAGAAAGGAGGGSGGVSVVNGGVKGGPQVSLGGSMPPGAGAGAGAAAGGGAVASGGGGGARGSGAVDMAMAAAAAGATPDVEMMLTQVWGAGLHKCAAGCA